MAFQTPGSYLLILLIFISLFARLLFYVVQVSMNSMSPVLKDGDWVLVFRFWPIRWLKSGQILIFRYEPTEWNPMPRPGRKDKYIKRLVGLPGDKVMWQRSSSPQFELDNHQLELDHQENWIWTIPPDHCYVRGDEKGYDSDMTGPVPLRCIEGKVVLRFFNRAGDKQGNKSQ